MAVEGEGTSNEVTLFLDGSDLYMTGDAGAIEALRGELLGPDAGSSRHSASALTGLAAVGGTLAASSASGEGLLRLTTESADKLKELRIDPSGGGVLSGVARGPDGSIAKHLSFESVKFGPEQALAMQTAAVSLALRSAIADVQAAVEAVDKKVSDLQRRVRAKEVGEILGTFRYLQRIADATRTRGRLLDADWDQVAGARKDLETALESLRAYVIETINDIDRTESLPKRQEAIEQLASPKGAAGSLRLILVAEQAIHLWEYLRLERIRATDPDHLPSALAEAKAALTEQRERDAELVRSASDQIEAAKHIGPLDIHRVLAIPQMERTVRAATEALHTFATSSRADMPTLDGSISRPQLSETRDEVKRQALVAKDGFLGASRIVGQVTSRGAKKTSDAVRKKARREPE